MTEGRGTQISTEVGSVATDPKGSGTQISTEVGSVATDPKGSGTHISSEVVSVATAPEARHTQILLSVARIGDNPPPFVRNQFPAPGAVEIAVDSNIVFTVDDYPGDPGIEGVDLTTVVVEIQVGGGGYQTAYTSSAFVAPFNGPGSSVVVAPDSSLGYKFTIDPTLNFPESTSIDVRVTASDME